MKKPFIVRTNDINVSVVGTKFDVSAYSKEWQSRVVLASGRVNVSLKGENDKSTKKLMPNQMYSLNVKKKESIQNVDASKYIAWIADVYICNDENMERLLNKLMQTYGVKITYGKDITSLYCTGKFDLQQPLSELLKEISEIMPIKYQKNNDGTYVVQKME
jgi:ferric-dicitrate binding protein FerR (iron transport regulator)